MPGLQDMLSGGGLQQTAQEVVSEVTGQPQDQQSGSFNKRLTESDLITDGTTLSDGEFTKTGDFVVPAQERYRWGFGAAKHEANQGYLYVDLQTSSPSAIDGLLRVQQRDAQEREIVTVYEERTNVLDGSQTDRTQQQAFPEQRDYPKVGRDSKLNLSMDPDSDDSVSQSDSTVLAPVTVYPT